MDALVYSPEEEETARICEILQAEGITARRDPLDGHGHYEYGYSIVIVAVEGARGMEIVRNWSDRYPGTQIIWISGDPYFAGVAMEKKIHDFITRPYDPDRLHQSVRRAMPKCPETKTWHFGA